MSEFISFAIEHWHLFGILFVILGWLVYEEVSGWVYGSHEISTDEVSTAINKGEALLDIRSKEKFTESHIPASVWVNVDKLKQFPEKKLDKNQSHILYCEDGTQSSEVASSLRRKQGYNVRALEGGFNAWKDQGFIIKNGKEK